jgi:hypothetical protein
MRIKESGFVIYEGKPSFISAKYKNAKLQNAKLQNAKDEIVVIQVLTPSKNRKTGNMMQSFILNKNLDPMFANKNGLDLQCGSCKLAGEINDDPNAKTAKDRVCYVSIYQSVLAVFKSFKKGNYPKIDPVELAKRINDDPSFDDRGQRHGSYGDTGTVPFHVLDSFQNKLDEKKKRTLTGYTNQYTEKNASIHDFLMISANSLEQADQAWQNKKRTFRVLRENEQITKNEILCPFPKVQCNECGLCDGRKNAKSIAIEVHGAGKKNLLKMAG